MRLVGSGAEPLPAAYSSEVAGAYDTGLMLAGHMRTFFPEICDEVFDWPATPSRLLQICQAFLGLVDEQKFPLDTEWYEELYANVNVDALTSPALDDDGALNVLTESAQFFDQPWPSWYGLGIQSALWYGLGIQSALGEIEGMDGAGCYSALTLALRKLFDRSPLSLGYDLADVCDFDHADLRRDVELVLALAPLPVIPDAECLERVLAKIILPSDWFPLPDDCKDVTAEELIRYAFGRTSYDLANYTSFEASEIFGENSLQWKDLDEITEGVRIAQSISNTYQHWEHVVRTDPERILQVLRQACLQAMPDMLSMPDARPRTLVELYMNQLQPHEGHDHA